MHDENQQKTGSYMRGYEDFPPINSFRAILKKCPRAAELYILLWQSRKNHTEVYIKAKDVRKIFNTTPTIFKNNLHMLEQNHVLICEKTDNLFFIEFI